MRYVRLAYLAIPLATTFLAAYGASTAPHKAGPLLMRIAIFLYASCLYLIPVAVFAAIVESVAHLCRSRNTDGA